MPPNEQRQDDTYDDIQDVVERGDDALPKKREQADLHEVSAHRHKAGGDDSPPAHNSHIRHVHRSILPETAMLRQRQMHGRTAHWLTYRCNRRTCSLAARIFRSADGPRPQRPRGPGGFEMSERVLCFARAADGDRPRSGVAASPRCALRGVRPSSGAASQELRTAGDKCDALRVSGVAAPEDGRTPPRVSSVSPQHLCSAVERD